MQTWHRDLHVGLENARLRPLRVILQASKVGRTWFWWCPRATKNQTDPVQNQKVQSGAENHHSHYNCSFEATWRSMTIILTVLKSSSPPLAKYHLTRNQKPDFHLVSGLGKESPWFGRDRVRISLWILDRPTKTVTFFSIFMWGLKKCMLWKLDIETYTWDLRTLDYDLYEWFYRRLKSEEPDFDGLPSRWKTRRIWSRARSQSQEPKIITVTIIVRLKQPEGVWQ